MGVIHNAGGYTAWSDKHPSYSSVAGPGGNTLDDYYSPEINSLVVPLPGVATPEALSCTTVPDPSQVSSWTDSFQNIKCYDTLKVRAILKQIHGKTHNGASAQVPNIFGMNFQAVSVGQKLIEANVGTGGYIDGAGTPTTELLGEFQFIDASIGEMVTALKNTGNFESTLIVITAKHGQAPVDPNRFFPTGRNSGYTTPADLIANLLPSSESPTGSGIGPTQDDVSLLWLKNAADTTSAVVTLEKNGTAIGLGTIFYGPTLALNYNTPGLPPYGDPRTPDIIVTPNPASSTPAVPRSSPSTAASRTMTPTSSCSSPTRPSPRARSPPPQRQRRSPPLSSRPSGSIQKRLTPSVSKAHRSSPT